VIFLDQSSLKTKGIQSFERAVYILDEIKNSREPLTLTELSRKTSMSKSSLQKYLISFLKLDIVFLNEEKKTYDLGPKLIDLGLNALNRIDIISVIDPYLLKIKEEFNQASVLALWTEKGPIIVKYQSSGKSINVEIEVGYNPSLLRSSVGKCFAAFLPIHVTEELLNKEITAYNLDINDVKKELSFTKKEGFAYRDNHYGDLPGSHTIASPILDYTEKVVGVLGIIGFSHDLNTDINSKEVIRLKEITKDISKLLSYQT